MKKLMTLVLAALGIAAANAETYYLVGSDGTGATSFFKSSNPSGPSDKIGWSLSQDGTVLDHTVAAGNDYVIPQGAMLRTAANDNADAFLGDTLTLAGTIAFKKAGNTTSPSKVITIPKLIADGGTLNNEYNDKNTFELKGALEIPDGKTLTILNQGNGNQQSTLTRNFILSETATGSGTVYVSMGGFKNQNNDDSDSLIDIAGDWSGFTGKIKALDGKPTYNGWMFVISGSFGGSLYSMPTRDGDPTYVFNLAKNPKGIRISDDATGTPPCIRYRSRFYGIDFANKKNIRLVRYPKSIRPNWELKYSASKAEAMKQKNGVFTSIPASELTYVDHGDGTETVVWHYVEPETPTFSGTITMDDWTEGETPSEPSGLTVTPVAAQGSLNYKYYKDSACTQPLSERPTLAGTYYVRGEVAEGDDGNDTFWKSAVSEPKEFTINQQAGAKTRVEIPVGKELSYTGNEQVGVDEGEHYTLSNTFKATAVGDYEAVATLENTDDYEWTDLTTAPKTIAWSIKKAVNTWTRTASITKTIWKSTEESGVITPPEAAFGEPKAQISKNGGAFEDWDDEMPTEKGRYEVRWTVADTDSYSELEDSVKFLIDYRYEPTAPFMVSTDGEKTWVGKATIDDACRAANSGEIIIEVCEDVATLRLSNTFANRTVTIRSNGDEDQPHVITVTGNDKFYVFNDGKLVLKNVVFNLQSNAKINRLVLLGNLYNKQSGSLEIRAGTIISGEVTSGLIQNENGNDGAPHTSIAINGGTIKDLTAGSSLISAPGDASFSVKNLTIENCTVSNGALIAAGNKTLNLSNVTITNNTTTAGAITVNYVNELTNGVIKVSGDVIVKDNKVGDDAKNIVLKNAANLQMVDALGANASVGVSFGEQLGDVFGSFTKAEATKGDMKTASAFKNDADAALSGKVNRDNELIWWKAPGLLIMIN